MFNWLRFSPLFLAWRARRAGEADGKALVPHVGDERPPKYLLYLRDVGAWRCSSIQLRWQSADRSLYPAYVRAFRLHAQAGQRLAHAQEQQAAMKAQHAQRPTERNRQALAEATEALRRARRRLERAELRLSRSQARRQARWEEYDAAFRALAAETDHYMQIYADTNIKHRDGNDLPPGLLEEHRPRLERPAWLQGLDWTVPPLAHQQPSLGQGRSLPG